MTAEQSQPPEVARASRQKFSASSGSMEGWISTMLGVFASVLWTVLAVSGLGEKGESLAPPSLVYSAIAILGFVSSWSLSRGKIRLAVGVAILMTPAAAYFASHKGFAALIGIITLAYFASGVALALQRDSDRRTTSNS